MELSECRMRKSGALKKFEDMKKTEKQTPGACLFCLSKDVQIQSADKKQLSAFIYCANCKVRSRLYPTASEAISAWKQEKATKNENKN